METMPSDNQKLICPSCKEAVETVHPFYTASEHLVFTSVKNQYTWWLLIVVLATIFWPLGIVAYGILYFYELKESKNKKLYNCMKCNIEVSYQEASNATKNTT
ncbi:MAG: hypothetical protein GXP13_09630 [Gammaproteobacteria bacterium]|nr:hypothetical protein [Gammaproteobacteria bacterium]